MSPMATFEELMAQAKARTTQQEETLRKAAAAKDRQERQRRLEGERKEAEKHRLEKVRLDRQRADDAAREARLEQERERRQTERASLHKHGRPASAKTSRGGTPSTGGAKTTAGAPELDGEARRELERKERAARAKAKLFEGDEDDAPPVRTGSRKLAPPAGGSKGKGKAGKPRTPAGGHPADCSLIRLNTTPRDIRTISEVERDMLLRKMGSADVQMADPGDERALWADPRALAKALDRSRPRPPAAEEEAAVSPRRATPRPSQASPVAKSKTGQALASKKRSRPGSDDEPRKRRADEDYRDEIWAIMGKRRSAYVGLSEDEDDDMEAGATDLFDEEFRSSRLARLEDQREEAANQRHAEEKRARLAAGVRRAK